ncbi:hypothetical protein FB451DRAFT_1252049 [Mycena latifolia]|nr:hypothetical protein FB451DRAFT_1252049 [Mycena latifolia]
MSAKELRARIEQLSADIVRQKEALKDLEHCKIVAQRQLNTVCDPMARLPLEISSEIFMQCLPSRPKPGGHAPMLLLSICSAWTVIALSTPALWDAIYVDAERLEDLAGVLDVWLQRAGSRALTISLQTYVPGDITAVIRCHVDQLQELEIFHDEDAIRLVAAAGPFPFLKTLTITGLPDAESVGPDIHWTLKMLRVCPNLVNCTFDTVSYSDAEEAEEEDLVLPHLRHLNFGPCPHSCSSEILMLYTSALNLETLGLSPYCLDVPLILDFIHRSSSALQKITLGSNPEPFDWTKDAMETCFHFLPILTHLEFGGLTQFAADNFVTILADSPHLFPNLSTITFWRPVFSHPPTAWYHRLVNALFSSRERIHFVRILWIEVPSHVENICAVFRQLVADGMTIHIGTEEKNYM